MIELWVQEAQETRKREMSLAMVKSHAKLLRKYLADNAKVAAIVEIIMYMQLGLYSLKRQEQVDETCHHSYTQVGQSNRSLSLIVMNLSGSLEEEF